MEKNDQHFATFRFTVPDFSIPPEERGLFALPANTEVVEERLELHDFRTATDVEKGPEGLDAQGFTYVNHRSALQNSDQWFTDRSVEETYIPEIEDLVCKVTGAKKAVVNNVAFRQKLAISQADPKWYIRRGDEIDQVLAKLPRDRAIVVGKTQDESLEPSRMAHIDYSPLGLRDSARYCRNDIREAAQPALDAEDTKADDVPRYAAYSRPLKTVKRDPLSVCDWRTVDKAAELENMQYRALSDINDGGEYIMDAYAVLPPKKPIGQKWYWVPEQKSDEVLILKFADTAADGNADIAGGCPHGSPGVEGTKDEEPRSSIECRVFAFW